MTDRDERRSQVPAGTFGSSEPPAPSMPTWLRGRGGRQRAEALRANAVGRRAGAESTTKGRASLERHQARRATRCSAIRRRRPPADRSRATGRPVLAAAEVARRRRLPRGRRAAAAREPRSPCRRRWPETPRRPAKPAGVPIGVMRSTVKTKVGPPPPPMVRPPPAARSLPSACPAGDDTLKDTIQQMLEQQASVPIQVDEGIPELRDRRAPRRRADRPTTRPVTRTRQRPPPERGRRPRASRAERAPRRWQPSRAPAVRTLRRRRPRSQPTTSRPPAAARTRVGSGHGPRRSGRAGRSVEAQATRSSAVRRRA